VWRGHAPAEALASLVALVEKRAADGDRFPLALRAAVTAVLCSPRFLFPRRGQPTGGAGVQALDELQLASRLSYFLWSCGPDEELLALAAKGGCARGSMRRSRACLADPRAEALARNFAVQWLELRELENVSRDPKALPRLRPGAARGPAPRGRAAVPDRAARGAAGRRPRDARVRVPATSASRATNRGPPLTGKPLRRVALEARRSPAAILALGGVLTVTANATRTSPTKRGKWVLDNLLDAPPPPPPPGSDSLKGERKIKDSANAARAAGAAPQGPGVRGRATGAWTR
jgi:hypothetical protein